MCRTDLVTVFTLNVREDVKWCIYDTLWKKIYPIKEAMREELLDASFLMQIMRGYFQMYDTPDTETVVVEEHTVRIMNCTNYIDAMLFDMIHLTNDNDNDYVPCFSYVCRLNHEHDDDDEDRINAFDIDIVFYVECNLELASEKRRLIRKLWQKMTTIEKLFLETNIRIIRGVDLMRPTENITDILTTALVE